MTNTNKYDRQLRLWGDDGQKRLNMAHILVVNVGGLGSEVLKNLVLPGIGQFTIIDNNKVKEKDLGNNFFVTSSSIGQPRGKIVMENLLDLNTDVTGKFIDKDLYEIIENDNLFLAQFDLIIATDISYSFMKKLSMAASVKHIPLIIADVYGLIGTVRLQLEDHIILDSEPGKEYVNLRIANPFSALLEYADSINFTKLDSLEYGHIPFVIILIKCTSEWKEQNRNELPTTFEEKRKFQEFIKKRYFEMNENKEVILEWGKHVNFVEAHTYYYYCFKNDVNDSTRKLLEHSNINSKISFWALVRALRDINNDKSVADTDVHNVGFVPNETIKQNLPKQLKIPCNGYIPDMTSLSDHFINLKQIYNKKAKEDIDNLRKVLYPDVNVTEEEIIHFCKRLPFIKIMTTSNIFSENIACDITIDQGEQTPFLWNLLVQAAHIFNEKYFRYPSESPSYCYDIDVQNYKMILDEIIEKSKNERIKNYINEKHIKEIFRYNKCQPHNISAIIGGIASQEAIKIITQKFVPIDNTYVFNGIAGIADTYCRL